MSGVLKSRVKAVVDELAETALADQGGDGDQADGGDRGDADAGDDRRHGQRQLDPHELAHGLKPMPRAASRTSSGTPSRPATMLRTMISSV